MDYDLLADYLSDHLWQKNKLDFEFLKGFKEFFYEGEGYRVIFLKDSDTTNLNFKNQSFAKTKQGSLEFIDNSITYDKEFVEGKNPKIYFCKKIEGFDLQKALHYFKEQGGLTVKTINNFIDEEEVICFDHSQPQLIKI